ncbi:hypothetical protein [Halobacillus salinus]|uniref:Uncharacterized protein n=1 Tax=Halobacillus salinus TaxID=192814 RepID=A0A4Z0GYH2_9BACI|nr:hypothetical protein [Halobacillus salinus]TGB02889.1 hypothetical protein E4663_12115 [Halobacillus salinus]
MNQFSILFLVRKHKGLHLLYQDIGESGMVAGPLQKADRFFYTWKKRQLILDTLKKALSAN